MTIAPLPCAEAVERRLDEGPLVSLLVRSDAKLLVGAEEARMGGEELDIDERKLVVGLPELALGGSELRADGVKICVHRSQLSHDRAQPPAGTLILLRGGIGVLGDVSACDAGRVRLPIAAMRSQAGHETARTAARRATGDGLGAYDLTARGRPFDQRIRRHRALGGLESLHRSVGPVTIERHMVPRGSIRTPHRPLPKRPARSCCDRALLTPGDSRCQ